MLDGLKGIGNSVLGYFGMSLDNFKLEQGPGGGYNISFKQWNTHTLINLILCIFSIYYYIIYYQQWSKMEENKQIDLGTFALYDSKPF